MIGKKSFPLVEDDGSTTLVEAEFNSRGFCEMIQTTESLQRWMQTRTTALFARIKFNGILMVLGSFALASRLTSVFLNR